MEGAATPGGLIRPYSGVLSELFRLSDAGVVFAALWALCRVMGVPWSDAYTTAGLAAVLGFIIWSQALSLYGSWRIATLRQEMTRLGLVWLGVLFSLLLLAYATKTSSLYSRRVVLSWMLGTPAALGAIRLGIRLFLRRAREQGRNLRKAAIVGSGRLGRQLRHIIHSSHWLGLELEGVYVDPISDEKQDHGIAAVPQGTFEDLVERARNGAIDIIFLATPIDSQGRLEQLTAALADTTASLYFVPGFFMSDLMHARWGYIEGLPYLSLRDTPFYGVGGTLKRTEDLVLGSLILLLVTVPMLVIALAIKLTSRGPTLFKQHRYGLDGREIEVWKFRTMSVTEDGNHVPQAKRRDPRVTLLGGFLRKYSLDELPQFINVLQGRMSIVGPRPHAVAHNELYRKRIYRYMLRHKVRPGITGWAQINGWRGETEALEKMEGRVEADLWYIAHWSLWLDLRIILLTIPRVLFPTNAY